MEQVIIDSVLQINLRIWTSTKKTCLLYVERRKAGRDIKFNNITFLPKPFKYSTYINMEMKWMVVDWAEKRRSRAVRAPLPIKRPAPFITCCVIRDMIHVIGVQKMK